MMAVRSGRHIAVAALLVFAGCSEPEQIRVHDEAPTAAPTPPTITAEQKQYRTLVAMVPVEGPKDGWWFLKLSGPTAVVNKYEADFEKLFNSISTSEDRNNPISWQLPPNWTKDEPKPDSIAFATLKSAAGEAEISVTRAGGSVMSNVQRWWGQLWGKEKAQDVTAGMLPQFVQQSTVNGRLILRVDLYGPKEPPKGGMMMNPHAGGM
jgi:hypothetical protein